MGYKGILDNKGILNNPTDPTESTPQIPLSKFERTNNTQLDGDGKRDTANERQRVAGSGDGVLAMLCCRVVTEMVLLHSGWLRCFKVAWL